MHPKIPIMKYYIKITFEVNKEEFNNDYFEEYLGMVRKFFVVKTDQHRENACHPARPYLTKHFIVVKAYRKSPVARLAMAYNMIDYCHSLSRIFSTPEFGLYLSEFEVFDLPDNDESYL